MSTTTNFKRIALVAVAALGLGVLSSVPSQAVTNADNLALSVSTASQTTAETATSTSAVATAYTLIGAYATDSMSVVASLVSAPTGATALPYLQLTETTTSIVDTATSFGGATVPLLGPVAPNTKAIITSGANGVAAAKFKVYLGEGNSTTAPTVVGTYVVKLTPSLDYTGSTLNATAQTLTITVTAAATLDTAAAAATSKVYLQADGSNAVASVPAADSSVVAAKAGGTKVGYIYIKQYNAASGAASESITAAISGSGTLGTGIAGASVGRSLSVKVDDTVTIYSDGTSGTGTITITGSTSGNLLSTKTVTFYGAVSALTGTVKTAILDVTANTAAVAVGATDASSVKVRTLASGESIYAFSSDTTIATVPSTAVSYSVDSAVVTVTGVKAGSATITFGNASTLAASTIKSAPITVRVGSTSVASVSVAFDKATYAPGEVATITLSLKDSTGQLVVPGTYELWAGTYGLASAKNFSQGTAPATTETAVTTSSTTGLKTYTVYMPLSPGTVTLSGTLALLGSSTYAPVGTLKTAAAIQGTTVTGSTTVSDSGSAALAAVTALATTVASLKTLIVTLTNLVLKIQKKVKA